MTDLRDQLRQAVTVEERAAAIKALVLEVRGADGDPSVLHALLSTIEEAERFAPALLLGVVAAMVPDGTRMEVRVSPWGGQQRAVARVAPMAEDDMAVHPECAVALAILEARG